MKFTTTILTLIIPFCLFGQDCEFFSLDTVKVCGYEYDLDIGLQEGTISYGCENEQYLSINYANEETNLAFSSCGTYELIYNATDGSCIDTLLIQVSDPNSSTINKYIDIGLDYGDIDCPENVNASCFQSGVSISLGSGTPTPVWAFCSTTTCQTSIYTSDTLGNVTGCLADSIVLDTLFTSSSSDYCSDTMQNAFIVLNSDGDTVTNNTFLDYLAQLQDTSNVDCFFPGIECSFTNTATCYDSIVMDTSILPIPVRVGGQWTMPMIDTLQLYDTTYFNYLGKDYELILDPGVDFYGPGDLNVNLNEIYISNSNDTTLQYPYDFHLTLQWEEEWIIDTIIIIREKYFDTDDDCFSCGGSSSGSGFNVPEIPDFPCGPVSIYYPSICECEDNIPDFAIQQIQCQPRIWRFELLSGIHDIVFVNGASADITGNIAILSNPTSQNINIESFDFNGCVHYSSIYLDDYINDYYISTSGDLSCENESTTLQVFGNFQFSSGALDLSNTVWDNQQVGSSITVTNEGNYSASFTDGHGCVYSVSTYVDYDHTIECYNENPLADTECNMDDFDIICDIMTFESFDYIMPSQNSGGDQPQGLCDGGGFADNMSWFSFVAYSGDYSLNITPSNCSWSADGQQGIQVGLYSDCTFSNSAFCASDCSVDNVSVPSQDLIEGQVYHMFIDGCQGSVCSYSMEIQGNPELPSLAPESITLSVNSEYIPNANTGIAQEYCLGTDVNSSLQGVEIEGEYFWSVNTLEGDPYLGDQSTITGANDLSLTFNTEGIYEVCIDEIRNGCDQFTWTGQMCFTVIINNTDDEDFGVHYVCEGQESNFDSSIFSDIDPNQDGQTGILGNIQDFQTGVNTIIAIDLNGCEYEQEFEIQYHAESDIQTIEITDCYSSLPIEINGTLLYEADFNEDNLLNIDFKTQEPNQHGCDSIINYTIELLDNPIADFSIPSDSICITDQLILTMTSVQGLIQNWDFDGGINVGTVGPILQFDSPGWKTISLITDNGICTSEQMSHSVYIEKQMDEIQLNCVDQGTHSLLLEWNELEDADAYIIKVGNQPAVTVTSTKYFVEQLEESTEYNIEISVLTNHRCPPPTALSSCSTRECENIEFTFDIPDMLCITDDMDIVEMKTTMPDINEGLAWSGENINGNMFDPNGLTAGVYQFEITHQVEGCISSGIIEVTIVNPPEFDMIYDEQICYGEESTLIEFSVSSESYTILIDGEAVDIVSDIAPGAHEILVINSDLCAIYESIFIEESEEIILNILGDIDIKEGDEHTFSIDETMNIDIDFNTLTWFVNGLEYCTGAECLTISPALDSDSEIELIVLNNEGCEISSIVRVEVEELEAKLVIPNIFSPNNDGVNDYWFVVPNKDDVKIENIRILDRWNNLVYSQSDGASNGDMKWDGKMNGADLQPGVYVYAVSYSSDNNVETVYGDITIIK